MTARRASWLTTCVLALGVVLALGTVARPVAADAAGADDLEAIRALVRDGRYDEAERQARAALATVEAAHGADSLEAAAVLDVLVWSLWRGTRANEPDALVLAQRALRIRETRAGRDDVALAPTLVNLGEVLRGSGRPAEALAPFERALALREKALGPDDPAVGRSLATLASLLADLGLYTEAKPLYARELAIKTKTLGADHPEVAGTLYNQANLLFANGEYAEARDLYERARAMVEKTLGPSHVRLAWVLNGLGNAASEMGEYPRARALYESAIGMAEKTVGTEDPFIADVLKNLGFLLCRMGDFSSAREAYGRALDLTERARGPEHPATAGVLTNRGELARLTGDLTAARRDHERALAIRIRAYGDQHPEVATSLDYLGAVYAAQGETAQALGAYRRALAVWEADAALGRRDIGTTLYGLAGATVASGDAAGGRALLERAARVTEEARGPDHPELARVERSLGAVQSRLGDTAGALHSALAAERISRDHLRLTAAVLPERQALRYAEVRPSGIDLMLSLAARGLDPVARKEAWDALIRSRALVLDAMASRNRRASAADDPEVERLRQALAAASRRLAALAVGAGTPDLAARRRLLDEARREKERAEAALAARSTAYRGEAGRRTIGYDQVVAQLPPGSALVAYARYADETGPDGSPGGAAASYLAFVVRRGEASPAVVTLGSARDIDDLVARWSAQAGRAPKAAGGRSIADAEAAYRKAGEALRLRVWDRLAQHLEGARRVFIVPDGALHLVSMGALPIGVAGYLVERDTLLQPLSAERDLVPPAAAPAAGRGLLVLGAADFDASGAPGGAPAGAAQPATAFRGERSACGDFRTVRFGPLPESGREAEAIAALWKNGPVTRLSGRAAGEAAFKAGAPGKRVLHLATHGFFLGGACAHGESGGRGLGALVPASDVALELPPGENPLLLSGLVLAGANQRGAAGAGEEDGILTAEEVAALDLSGVEWAVLSGCDTGAGHLEAGEGVLGLRRAFQVAGARTVVMSLWPVEDRAGREWMEGLYDAHVRRGRPTAEAMREAALRVLEARRGDRRSTHPFYWGGWVAVGA